MRKVPALLLSLLLTLPSLEAQEKTIPIGLRADGSKVHARISPESFQVDSPKPHLLVVGNAPVQADGWIVTRVEAPREGLTFPPAGNAYEGDAREAHYLWRWVEMLGPDAVLGEDALSQALVAGGKIAKFTPGAKPESPSPAREELRQRQDRTPLQVTQKLGEVYGYGFKEVAYIPALSLVGRLRLAEMTKDAAMAGDVRRIAMAAPEPKSLGGVTVAGHLIYAELAKNGDFPEALARVKHAASVGVFPDGRPRDFVGNHSEMSDAVFMDCPLLAAAGALTGEKAYYEACVNHLRFMKKMCLREDGIYRHSPLDEAAWGRGNGFPALGLAWSLAWWPADAEPDLRKEVQESLKEHLTALAPHQDASGMWHQVIDHPESYREFTSTCMIAYAMIRGVKEGWLPKAEYEPRYLRAWDGIKLRIDLDGRGLVDVCTGTGKQATLEDYFLRTAILGKDDRGGAMALILATELAAMK